MPGWKLLVGFHLIRFKRVASDLEKNIYFSPSRILQKYFPLSFKNDGVLVGPLPHFYRFLIYRDKF